MTNPFSLQGKTVLVTGASSGIGQQTAISVSQAGANVIVTARDHARLSETFNQLQKGDHQLLLADLTQADSLKQLVGNLPQLDGIVHSAGITGHLPAKFITQNDLEQYFSINYSASVLLMSQILKQKKLNPASSLVFLSSVASKYPYFGGALYSSSKAAIEAYSRALSVELAAKKIRSNCVSPSFVKTPMIESVESISGNSLENFEKMMPLGFGEPNDVANAIIYLLSDASKWTTGTNLVLGGG